MLVASASVVAPAFGADADPVAATVWVSRGFELYKHQQYDEARQAFGRAYASQPDTGTLLNLAMAELQSGHALDAAGHLRAYLKAPDAPSDRLALVGSKWLPQAEARIGRLVIDAPAGAEVRLDGFIQGQAPFPAPIDVAAGDHELEARLGSWSRTIQVSAPAGQLVAVKVDRADDASPPSPPAPGPASAKEIARPAPARQSSVKIITVSSLGGAAVIATAFAVGFGIASRSAYDRGNAISSGLSSGACLPPQPAAACPQLQSDYNELVHDHSLSVGFYVGGGVLAGAAVITWLVWPSTKDKSAWGLRPTFDAHTGGAAVVGSF